MKRWLRRTQNSNYPAQKPTAFSYPLSENSGVKTQLKDVHDIHATILHLMGLGHELLTYFHQGRQESLTDVHGHVIQSVLA